MAERHGLADHLEGELPKLRGEWEAGSASALIEAFLWCAGNVYPFPQWLTTAVIDELEWSRLNRPRGGTKVGNSEAFERNETMHRVRYLLMEQMLTFQRFDIQAGLRTVPISEIEAARSVQDFLVGRNHVAQGSPESIRKSYKRLKNG